MNQQTLALLGELKLTGMQHMFSHLIEQRKADTLTADELLSVLVQAEWEDRQQQRLERLFKAARFRYQAAVAEVTFPATRQLDKNTFLRLSDAGFVARKENVLITGPTGVGKRFLASALGHQACLKGYKVAYFNVQKLFARLQLAKSDGTYLKEINRIEKQDLLLLDDFGLQPLTATHRMDLLEIIEDRHGRRSTIICSQLPVSNWYQLIEDSTIADALLDRLIHGAHRLELKGESMRKNN